MSDSRIETLLEALLNNTEPPQEPMSRVEEYLYALVKNSDPPTNPSSRIEAYLAALCEKGVGGGSGSGNVDFSNATAAAEDIAVGKTAYTADGLTTGTMESINEIMGILQNGTGKDWVSHICPYTLTTATERATYIMQLAECARILSADAHGNTSTGCAEHREIILADGTVCDVSIGINPVFILPPMQFKGRCNMIVPLGDISDNADCYVDLSNATFFDSTQSSLRSIISRGRLSSLILSDQHRLDKCIDAVQDRSYFLTNGLRVGKKVVECSSSWIKTLIGTWHSENIQVFVPEGFEGTIYLSKLPLSVETMINIFNNLADMAGTGTTYILNIGTENIDKLTTEQLEIAHAKGWEVT